MDILAVVVEVREAGGGGVDCEMKQDKTGQTGQ